jgi:hypothetical protein
MDIFRACGYAKAPYVRLIATTLRVRQPSTLRDISSVAGGERNLTYHESFLDRVWDDAHCVHGAAVRPHCRETKSANERVNSSLVCAIGRDSMDLGSRESHTPQLLVAGRTSEELLERALHPARRCWRMACSWLGQNLL